MVGVGGATSSSIMDQVPLREHDPLTATIQQQPAFATPASPVIIPSRPQPSIATVSGFNRTDFSIQKQTAMAQEQLGAQAAIDMSF